MIELVIPGRGNFYLEHLVLDLNGTIALDGRVIEGVGERLQNLGRTLNIYLVTADTLGNAEKTGNILKIKLHKIGKDNEDVKKLDLIQQLGAGKTVCIGNGLNDVLMLKNSTIGICVVGGEGAAFEAVAASDLVVNNINDALDLLLNPSRIIATLRK